MKTALPVKKVRILAKNLGISCYSYEKKNFLCAHIAEVKGWNVAELGWNEIDRRIAEIL